MAPFIMQIGGRDSPDQLAKGRLRINRIAWIDVALPRSRLWKHRKVNKLRSLGVPREIGPHLARRHVGQRFGNRLSCHESIRNACRRDCEETPARKWSFFAFGVNWSVPVFRAHEYPSVRSKNRVRTKPVGDSHSNRALT